MDFRLSRLIAVGVWIVPLVPGAIVAHRVYLLAKGLEFWGDVAWFPLVLSIAGGVAYELMAIGAGHALVHFYSAKQWDRFGVAAVVIGFYLWGGLSEVGLTLLGSFFVVAPFMYILQFFQEEIEGAEGAAAAALAATTTREQEQVDFDREQERLDREAERQERAAQAAFGRELQREADEEKRRKRQESAAKRAANKAAKQRGMETAGSAEKANESAAVLSVNGDSPEVERKTAKSSKRWSDLLPEEIEQISGMSTAEIKALYPGKSDRTYRDWKRQAAERVQDEK